MGDVNFDIKHGYDPHQGFELSESNPSDTAFAPLGDIDSGILEKTFVDGTDEFAADFDFNGAGSVMDMDHNNADNHDVAMDSGVESDVSLDAYEMPMEKAKLRGSSTGLHLETSSAEDDNDNSTGLPAAMVAHERLKQPSVRRHGGLARGWRNVSAVLDEDDQLIFSMKQNGYGDKQIVELLKKRGIHYDPKSITTRYRRIREAKMAATDVLLKDRKKQWNEAEDNALLMAHANAMEKRNHELKKVEARVFTDTAFKLAGMIPSTFYSAEACEKRFHELMSGKARAPAELDDTPERRREDAIARLEVVNLNSVAAAIKADDEVQNAIVDELVKNERERRQHQAEKRKEKKEPSSSIA